MRRVVAQPGSAPGRLSRRVVLAAPLLAACAHLPTDRREPAMRLGRLGWGVDPATGAVWTDAALRSKLASPTPDGLDRRLRDVATRAAATLDTPIVPVATLRTEGTLFTDPVHKASAAATAVLPDVFCWAVCARVAAPDLAARCGKAARAAVDAWVATYRPSGNPIDENPLLPLLQAVDLLLPSTTADARARAVAWVRELARAGDAFYAPLRTTDTRTRNNWASWRYALRAVCATIAEDTELVADTRKRAAMHAAQNVGADGATFDFRERDALHYHVYDLEALAALVCFAPGAADAATVDAFARGLGFLEPYATVRATHVEFVNSPVPFDRQRREAGDPVFRNAPWDPKDARGLLWLGDALIPTAQSWTRALRDEAAHPRTKLLAALRGAP